MHDFRMEATQTLGGLLGTSDDELPVLKRLGLRLAPQRDGGSGVGGRAFRGDGPQKGLLSPPDGRARRASAHTPSLRAPSPTRQLSPAATLTAASARASASADQAAAKSPPVPPVPATPRAAATAAPPPSLRPALVSRNSALSPCGSTRSSIGSSSSSSIGGSNGAQAQASNGLSNGLGLSSGASIGASIGASNSASNSAILKGTSAASTSSGADAAATAAATTAAASGTGRLADQLASYLSRIKYLYDEGDLSETAPLNIPGNSSVPDQRSLIKAQAERIRNQLDLKFGTISFISQLDRFADAAGVESSTSRYNPLQIIRDRARRPPVAREPVRINMWQIPVSEQIQDTRWRYRTTRLRAHKRRKQRKQSTAGSIGSDAAYSRSCSHSVSPRATSPAPVPLPAVPGFSFGAGSSSAGQNGGPALENVETVLCGSNPALLTPPQPAAPAAASHHRSHRSQHSDSFFVPAGARNNSDCPTRNLPKSECTELINRLRSSHSGASEAITGDSSSESHPSHSELSCEETSRRGSSVDPGADDTVVASRRFCRNSASVADTWKRLYRPSTEQLRPLTRVTSRGSSASACSSSVIVDDDDEEDFDCRTRDLDADADNLAVTSDSSRGEPPAVLGYAARGSGSRSSTSRGSSGVPRGSVSHGSNPYGTKGRGSVSRSSVCSRPSASQLSAQPPPLPAPSLLQGLSATAGNGGSGGGAGGGGALRPVLTLTPDDGVEKVLRSPQQQQSSRFEDARRKSSSAVDPLSSAFGSTNSVVPGASGAAAQAIAASSLESAATRDLSKGFGSLRASVANDLARKDARKDPYDRVLCSLEADLQFLIAFYRTGLRRQGPAAVYEQCHARMQALAPPAEPPSMTLKNQHATQFLTYLSRVERDVVSQQQILDADIAASLDALRITTDLMVSDVNTTLNRRIREVSSRMERLCTSRERGVLSTYAYALIEYTVLFLMWGIWGAAQLWKPLKLLLLAVSYLCNSIVAA